MVLLQRLRNQEKVLKWARKQQKEFPHKVSRVLYRSMLFEFFMATVTSSFFVFPALAELESLVPGLFQLFSPLPQVVALALTMLLFVKLMSVLLCLVKCMLELLQKREGKDLRLTDPPFFFYALFIGALASLANLALALVPYETCPHLHLFHFSGQLLVVTQLIFAILLFLLNEMCTKITNEKRSTNQEKSSWERILLSFVALTGF
ncbi:hypothetical protein HAT2_00699 [Candidatus Similichlamydia laticola]|uniref:Uncharacterized protein n=2 Tax=Candidatus Similichlamydia laticola TaxID=2170265 RepID=A0A369K9E6_9BACT|nr:hypothetical protein HAT2_00699 [Candidatus Similichlamydia laticola]